MAAEMHNVAIDEKAAYAEDRRRHPEKYALSEKQKASNRKVGLLLAATVGIVADLQPGVSER